MDLRSLNTFIQAAELSSFSKAGEKLGYSQPTVSIQIKQLEQELGIRLFDRIGHTVRLTDRGREVLPHAQRICQMCQEMALEQGHWDEVSGTIRIGAADSLCAPLMSEGFSTLRRQYPNISLTLTTGGTEDLFRMLDQNEVDLVCTLDSHIYNTRYVVAGEEKIGVHFVVPGQSPLADKAALTQEDLLSQPFLLTEKGMSYRRLLDEWMARDAKEIHPILELGSADLLCRLVGEGVGISFLPDYVTREAVQAGRVVLLDAEGFEPELWKQLLHHRDKWVSRPMQAVIHHFSELPLER